MKQFTIWIPDNKVEFFVELMKSISFVKSIEEEKVTKIPEEHKSMVRERIQKYENSPESYVEWDEMEEKFTSSK
jgi:hypothetical protein